jgi:signal transduction histidine kinase
MEGTAGRMQDLIDALLEYSRLVRTGQPFRSVDLKAVALEVLGDLETRIAETGARVEIGDLPEIDADPAQMRQLLQNLVSNALKYHRPGTPPEIAVDGRCRAGAGRPGGEVCEITVTDNGIGFDEQFLDRIFTPFQRLHGRKQFQGTGIGLAIVRKIVERHGGTVTARSEPGQGATFIVELPRRQPGTGAGGRARPAAPGRRGAP